MKTTVLLHAVLCTIYNGSQRYEQFLQVGRLYQALMLLFTAVF